MRTRERVTVTVPSEVLAAAEEDVESGHAPSVSAWVADAMATKARTETLAKVISDIAEETGGPLTDEELAWARERLDP